MNYVADDVIQNEIVPNLSTFHAVLQLKLTSRRYSKLITLNLIKNALFKTFSNDTFENGWKYHTCAIRRFKYTSYSINTIDGLDILKMYHSATNIGFVRAYSSKLLKYTFSMKCTKRLQFLIENGVNVNTEIKYKKLDFNFITQKVSPLHFIITFKHGMKGYFFDWAVEQLLIAGADPDATVMRQSFGMIEELTTLDKIILNKEMRYLVPLFLKHGATSNIYKAKKISKIATKYTK